MIQTKGIVLNEMRFQDTSKILNIYTKELGKINIMAKGAYKPKSKILAQTQPFASSDFEIYKGRSWYYIKEAELLNSYYNIREQIERMSVGFYILELVNKSVPEESKHENIYLLLEKTLETLSNLNSKYLELLLAFEIKYISFLGYRPSLCQCSNCGKTEYKSFRFSIALGGLLCSDCYFQDTKSLSIDKNDVINLNNLLYVKLDSIYEMEINRNDLIRLQNLMEQYILYCIDRKRLDSAEMLRSIIYD